VIDLLKPFATGLVTLLVLDLAWIGVIANQFYKRELGAIARLDGDSFAIRLAPALLLYPLMVLGVQLFVLPRVDPAQWWSAALWGGLFGLVGYGIYDLTNYATLTAFSWRMTVVDMSWGTVLLALTATAMSTVSSAR